MNTRFKTCPECEGTGHGGPDCPRNPIFGCMACDGLGEVDAEDEE